MYLPAPCCWQGQQSEQASMLPSGEQRPRHCRQLACRRHKRGRCLRLPALNVSKFRSLSPFSRSPSFCSLVCTRLRMPSPPLRPIEKNTSLRRVKGLVCTTYDSCGMFEDESSRFKFASKTPFSEGRYGVSDENCSCLPGICTQVTLRCALCVSSDGESL